MAVQKFLSVGASGRATETLPLAASAGVGSAGAIVALAANGLIDPTMIPSQITTVSLPATEALSAGAFVNIWSSPSYPSVRNADGSTSGKEAWGFVLSAVASSASATVQLSGLNTSATGMVAGPVFLSGTTPGQASATVPTAAGSTVQILGVAVSATAIDFAASAPITRA